MQLESVNMVDAGGISALTKLIEHGKKNHVQIMLTNVQEQPLHTLKKANLTVHDDVLQIFPTLQEACAAANL